MSGILQASLLDACEFMAVSRARRPDEADTDEGALTLRWQIGDLWFCCAFNGDGKVTGVFSSLTVDRPASFRMALTDEALPEKVRSYLT